MIACCTIAEGIIQYAIGDEEFENRIAGTRASPKGPAYSPFMLRDGIPHEEGFFECERERLMGGGDDIGEGQKIRLMKLDGSSQYLYTVESNKMIFCREMVEKKKDCHFRLSPKVTIYQWDAKHGHAVQEYARFPKATNDNGSPVHVRHKFKALL